MSLERYSRAARAIGGFSGGTSRLTRPWAELPEADVRPPQDYAGEYFIALDDTNTWFASTGELCILDETTQTGAGVIYYDDSVSLTYIQVTAGLTISAGSWAEAYWAEFITGSTVDMSLVFYDETLTEFTRVTATNVAPNVRYVYVELVAPITVPAGGAIRMEIDNGSGVTLNPSGGPNTGGEINLTWVGE